MTGMKKIITFALASLMVFSVSYDIHAQDKKAEKKARREARRQDKAITDSLRTLMEGSDSVNVGYGYVKKSRMNTRNAAAERGVKSPEVLRSSVMLSSESLL